jgi:mRNA interferase MazF
VRRGEVVTVAARGAYSGKPRPAVVVQLELFADLESVTVCLMSSELVEAPLLRIVVDPTPDNGLEQTCQIMIDKVVTVPVARIGQHVGTLDQDTLLSLDRSLALFLGIA